MNSTNKKGKKMFCRSTPEKGRTEKREKANDIKFRWWSAGVEWERRASRAGNEKSYSDRLHQPIPRLVFFLFFADSVEMDLFLFYRLLLTFAMWLSNDALMFQHVYSITINFIVSDIFQNTMKKKNF